MRLADAAGRRNRFDLLRLIAAACVLLSHSFALVGAGEPMIGGHSLGFLGVEVFFAISGYLVTRSWLADPSLVRFLAKRTLRILPALALCVLVTAFVLGPLLSDRSLAGYLGSSESIAYPVRNLLAVLTGGLLSGPAYELPGVFAANPHDASVNGSLWTLPVEVQAYFLVAVLGMLGLLLRRWPAAIAVVFVALAARPSALAGVPILGHAIAARPESLTLMATFLVGAALASGRDRVVLRLDAAALALALWIVTLGTTVEPVVTALALPYLVLVAAYRTSPRLDALTRPGDVSYGLYLFAFPLQQLALELWPDGTPPVGVLFAMTLPVTYALALLSWRAVEAPALRLKDRLGAGRPRPASVAAPPVPLVAARAADAR
jgi:peptidoglycan/LPS O-acetylase OafA/YrhL